MSVRVPGWKNVRQSWRWLRSRSRPHVVILGYHRVRDEASDPFDLSVTPAELDEQLRFLVRYARPVALQQAVRELLQGAIVPRSVVVTFDDGYDDTVTTALPLLRKHAVPATVFITTGTLGEPFWWDAIAACLLEPPSLPDHVIIEASGRRHTYATHDRTSVLQQVAALLRPLDSVERTASVAALMEQTMPHGRAALPRALRTTEIEQLAEDPLIEIGAHSETHPVLAELPEESQRREIENNRRALESLTRQPVRSFAYPNGSFGPVTQQLVQTAGFTVACSSVPDVALSSSDRLALPRLWVDGDRRRDFERWITRWLG
jgi:peptidoglycan/xylan/chitin deacetylase (PgdA/CDA1 family)